MRRVLAGLAVAPLVAASACGGAHPAAALATRITVSVDSCGQGWRDPEPGQQHFVLTDTDSRAGAVLLTDATNAAVYADVEPIGPGTSTDLDIELGSGRYAFRCAMEDESTITGPTVTIPGTVHAGAPPVQAVSQADLIAATQRYQEYVSGQLPMLVARTEALQDAIARGDLAAARTAWLSAHLEYERLGGAYDAFGALDVDINGLPDGLVGGVRNSGWSGFHRLEYGLWHDQSAPSLLAPASVLTTAVRRLRGEFATTQLDPLQLSIRAHEVTENALQFELTGASDFGSHSNIATLAANLAGTRTVLEIIHPLLVGRDGQLAALTTEFQRVTAFLQSLRGPDGYPPLAALAHAAREMLDSDVSELAEQLAPVASILEPRRIS